MCREPVDEDEGGCAWATARRWQRRAPRSWPPRIRGRFGKRVCEVSRREAPTALRSGEWGALEMP